MQGKHVEVYTDGACVNQGRKNAKAGYAVFFGDNDPRNFSRKLTDTYKQDSMMAELEAIRHALFVITKQIAARNWKRRGTSFTIYSDCINAIKSVKGTGEPSGGIRPLVYQCRLYYTKVSEKVPLNINHVRAHSGIYGNHQADKMAYRACK